MRPIDMTPMDAKEWKDITRLLNPNGILKENRYKISFLFASASHLVIYFYLNQRERELDYQVTCPV